MTPGIIWRMTTNVLLGSLAYRGFFALLMFERVLGPVIGLLIWLTVSAEGVALPYDRAQFIAYYVLLSVVSMVTGNWCAEYVAEQIRMGGLSTLLLRPAPYIAAWACDALGQKLLMASLLLPQIAVVGLFFARELHLHADPGLAALFLASLTLAAILAFLIQFNLGLLAFWMEDVGGVRSLESAARALLEVLTRDLSGEELARGFALQVTYTAAAYGLYRLLWWRGVRRYSATGA